MPFPVQLQEAFTDEEGNLMSRPVFDGDGNPVQCQEALAARDELIGKLASLPPVPAALDQIVHRFGHGAVAEVTGRSRRVLKLTDGGNERLALRPRPASANLAETSAFMEARSASWCSPWPAAPGAAITPISAAAIPRAVSTICWSPAGGPTRRSRVWAAPIERTRHRRRCSGR